jgi:hypothetical protein
MCKLAAAVRVVRDYVEYHVRVGRPLSSGMLRAVGGLVGTGAQFGGAIILERVSNVVTLVAPARVGGVPSVF